MEPPATARHGPAAGPALLGCAAALAATALSACGTASAHVSTARPFLSSKQAAAIQLAYDTTNNEINTSYDVAALPGVETVPQRWVDQAALTVAQRLRHPVPPVTVTGASYLVPAATGYPRWFVSVGVEVQDDAPTPGPVYRVFTQRRTGAPWKLAYNVEPADTVPAVQTTGGGAVDGRGTAGLALDPTALAKAVFTAYTTTTRSAFAYSDALDGQLAAGYQVGVASARQQGWSFRRTLDPGTAPSFALRTTDGGAIMFSTSMVSDTLRATRPGGLVTLGAGTSEAALAGRRDGLAPPADRHQAAGDVPDLCPRHGITPPANPLGLYRHPRQRVRRPARRAAATHALPCDDPRPEAGEAVMTVTLPALARLLAPVDVALFRRDHWEREPLHIQRDDPRYYQDLLTLADIDALLASGAPGDRLSVGKDGRYSRASELCGAGANAMEAVYQRFRDGDTIVLAEAHGWVERLRGCSRALTAEVSAGFRMSIQVTPEQHLPPTARYDPHDAFVLQVHGSSHWLLAPQPLALPLPSQAPGRATPAPEATHEFDLRAGDMVYLPRGTLHRAAVSDGVSAQVTVSVHGLCWAELAEDWLTEVCTSDVLFRRALPIGFARDGHRRAVATAVADQVLGALRGHLGGQDLLGTALDRASSLSWADLSGHLTDLDGLAGLTLATRVRQRPGLRCDLAVGDETARLSFHGKTVEFPASDGRQLSRVLAAGVRGLTPSDLPGDQPEQGRLDFVRRLVSEGFLTLA